MSPTQFQFVGSRPYDFTNDAGQRISGVTYFGIFPHDIRDPLKASGYVGLQAGKLPLSSHVVASCENLEVGKTYDATYDRNGRIVSYVPAKTLSR